MRYVLHPGYVTSKVDGQDHFINGPQLARLYGLELQSCIVVDIEYREQPGDVHLGPRYHGDYSLPPL